MSPERFGIIEYWVAGGSPPGSDARIAWASEEECEPDGERRRGVEALEDTEDLGAIQRDVLGRSLG